MKLVEKSVFNCGDFIAILDWISPDPRNLPNIDLPVGNDIAPRRGEMSSDARANTIDRLANVDWHLIEIAKYIAADFVSERTYGAVPKI